MSGSDPGITIAPLDRMHFEEAVRVYGAAFDEPYPQAAFLDLLDTNGSVALMACDGPTAVGFVIVRIILDEAEIISVGVDPIRQGQGIGAQLMHAAMAFAAKKAAALYLEVGADNPAALHLYLKLGFEHIGLRKNYYRRADRSRVDAHTMKCDLTRL